MAAMKNKKSIPLPWPVYFVPVLFLGLAGLADSIYLAISHYRNYTDIAYSSFCALSKAINCDTVSQSPWSIFFDMPLAIWGIFAYFLLFVFILYARNNSPERLPFWSLICLLSFLYSLSSIYFGYVSAVKIKAYCIMCILSYGINLFLFFYSYIILKRFCDFSFSGGLLQAVRLISGSLFLKASLAFLGATLLVVQVSLPHYWQYGLHADFTNIESGMTAEGHPWIGAVSPQLTIEEYTDYQCFQCMKMHHYLRNLVAKYSDKLRLVHRHFPLDREFNPVLVKDDFHVGSGRMALLAIAASYQGAFWEMSEALYNAASKKEPVIDIVGLAQRLELDLQRLQSDLVSRKTVKALRDDIHAGLQHAIRGTPSYVINGKVFSGTIPPEILQLEP